MITPEGEIRTDASEKLYQLTQEKKNAHHELDKRLNRLIKDNGMETILQDRFVTNREGRYVVPVKSGMQHQIEGIIHGSSQTKQTVFMEPHDAIPLNNRLRVVDLEIEEEIERLLRDMTDYLHSIYSELKATQECLVHIDVRWAQAQFSNLVRSQPCKFNEDELRLEQLFHPLLAFNPSQVIANDVELHKMRSILLLSGPNAGGKTVLLKAIGLAAHMARCGLPICASAQSQLPFFSRIHITVGDHQSVDRHLSTFAAHLMDLNQALSAKGTQSLLLIDEICGSTDPEEGCALARSFICEYARNQVIAVVTSHLGPLKTNWADDSGVLNGSLEYDMRSSRPTYRFIAGVSGQSQAIQTARRVGVESKIIDGAMTFLSNETREQLKSHDTLEQQIRELRTLQDKHREAHEEAKLEKEKYQKLNDSIVRESAQLINKAVTEAEKKLSELIQQAKVQDLFKQNEKLQEIKKQFPTVVKPAGPSRRSIDSADDFAKVFPPGTSLYVPSLKQKAVVQSLPNAKGEVMVQSQSMRLQLPWQQLDTSTSIQASAAQRSEKTKHSGFDSAKAATPSPSVTVDPIVDLRGKGVEEAIEHLEKELDLAARNSVDRIKVIHGHGTESLKKAIRLYLSKSTYVESWQSGTHLIGDDGITWIKINC